MTFFTTLQEKEREELLHSYSFIPLAAFIKVAGNCSDLESFPHTEDAAISRWSETWCHKGHDLWAISTPWSKSCFCAGSNLTPCYYNAPQRREPSAHRYKQQRAVTHKGNFSVWGFQDYSIRYALHQRYTGTLLIGYPELDSEKHIWTRDLWLCTLKLFKPREKCQYLMLQHSPDTQFTCS